MKNEFKIIANLLPNNSRVLDVGCGDGTLIEALINQKNIDARGMELDQNNVKKCIFKGLSVIEGNAETELGGDFEHLSRNRVFFVRFSSSLPFCARVWTLLF